MRKLFLLFSLGAVLIFPTSTLAQNSTTLQSVSVQLWPEYDQPSMLVLTDFSVPANTKLPLDLTFRIPKGANLIAVANYNANDALVDAVFVGPSLAGDWQEFTITMTSTSARFEYYDPISFNGNERAYSYLWAGDYAVKQFAIRVLEPLDVTMLSTDPQLPSISSAGEGKYYTTAAMQLAQGKEYALTLQYSKTSNLLVVEQPNVQPATPLDENTQGRVSLAKALPYVLGILGMILVIAGIYFWRSSGQPVSKTRRRAAHNVAKTKEESVYCSQCGDRAKPGDRFCRTCGARLKS